MQKILTTDDLRETKQHGQPDFQIQYYLDDTREFFNSQVDWHWHNEFEIVLVSDGSVDFHIGQHTFTLNAGEAIFINSRVLHQFTTRTYGVMPNIVFSPEFIAPTQTGIYQKYIAPVEKSALEYLVLRKDCVWQAQILGAVTALFRLMSEEGYNELQVRNLLSEAWLILEEQTRPLLTENERKADINFSHNSVMIMMQYIQAHYREPVSLDDIASTVSISKNTAIRYFNATIGMSPVDYLISFRINLACRLLKETSDKIARIAASVGYENTGYFCRLFKKQTGRSPGEFRRL